MNFLERLLHSSPWWADKDWEHLISQDILPRSIAYYPCDDIVHFRELISLIETFVGILKGVGYLLLDEITFVKNWPRAIKFLADAGKLEKEILRSGSGYMADCRTRHRTFSP
jgi:predicted AAA+ superfamily ATPase